MVISMVDGSVAQDKQDALQSAYRQEAETLPPAIVQTFLLRKADNPTAWRIMTIWRSAADLQEVRASAEDPPAIRIFKSAGADPTLNVFEVVHKTEA